MESDAQMTLNCLTRLRRGLHMHHASIVMPRTNNKLLCRLQGTPLAPYTAHGAQRTHSSRDEDTTFIQQARCLVVTVEDRVSGRETGVHSVTHVS